MPENCISISSRTPGERTTSAALSSEYHVIVLILCLVIILGSFLLYPCNDKVYLFGIEWPISCALHQNLGVSCILCGMTRSFVYFAEGSFSEAIRFHPFGPALFVFVCLQIVYRSKYDLDNTGCYYGIGCHGWNLAVDHMA